MNRGIRKINTAEYDNTQATERWETPVNQQTVESHVLVPLLIALIVSVFVLAFTIASVIALASFLSGYSQRPLSVVNTFTVFLFMLAWGGSFLLTFLWRIGVGDSLLKRIEEATGLDIDGDGKVGEGFTPRAIPHHVNGGSHMVDMPASTGPLKREAWARIAVALLNEQVAVSRRGMNEKTQTVSISQSEANQASKELHAAKKAEDNQLNGAGWDWLITFLPVHVQCTLERPDPPTHPNNNNAVGLGTSTNQPTSQPG